MHLPARGSRLPDTNKHKQLTPHKGRKAKKTKINLPTAKRYGRANLPQT